MPSPIADPDLPLLHTRTYDVRAYRKSRTILLLRGIVRDEKPAGLYVPDDPEPLTIHHMIVDLDIDMPTSTIVAVNVVFEDHPHEMCPSITEHYDKLVGLSVSRGYTHKVRELFGGPRGCTHITALLQAMGPVVNQSRFSMMMDDMSAAVGDAPPQAPSPEQRQRMLAGNLNTCHVWDEESERVAAMRRGEGERDVPIWIRKRFDKLGRKLEPWGPFQ